MFCYQRTFGSPTEVVTLQQFRALISAPRTFQQVKEAREALTRGDKNGYDRKKKGLPLVIFIGTFEESVKVIENKKTGEKKEVNGCWRLQKHCRLNGLCVIDFDHVTPSQPPQGEENKTVREIWEEAYAKLSDEELFEALTSLKGVGKKVANCVMLFGFHRIGAFPVDVWMQRVIDEHYGGSFPLERYEGFAGVMQQYLFYYAFLIISLHLHLYFFHLRPFTIVIYPIFILDKCSNLHI